MPTFAFPPHNLAKTTMAHQDLFRQIVTDTQKLLRLKLQLAQGRPVQSEIDQLGQAIALKQALLEGLSPPDNT